MLARKISAQWVRLVEISVLDTTVFVGDCHRKAYPSRIPDHTGTEPWAAAKSQLHYHIYFSLPSLEAEAVRVFYVERRRMHPPCHWSYTLNKAAGLREVSKQMLTQQDIAQQKAQSQQSTCRLTNPRAKLQTQGPHKAKAASLPFPPLQSHGWREQYARVHGLGEQIPFAAPNRVWPCIKLAKSRHRVVTRQLICGNPTTP